MRRIPFSDDGAVASLHDSANADTAAAEMRNPERRMLVDVKRNAATQEFAITIAGRACTIVHERALITWLDEQTYLSSEERRQYGTVLWPASIALALEIGERASQLNERTVLELGAGVGLAGIAAAIVGARVVQTDRDEDALALCRENAARNHVTTDVRRADWTTWAETGRYDWVIASDILYRSSLHEQLRAIFDASLAPGGTLLIADPLRSASVRFLEAMERDGWRVRMSRWTIGEGEFARAIGVFELRLLKHDRPRSP
ncbi:MAG TPA: 50S ribosomal protein L11 methyltransferase [Gemmatimonadaceae bacterium]|nr:50S ribosomal protein L11 methyltransferase [Gemmatimonadaceae bacterium]